MAILSSVLVSTVLRIGDSKIQNNMAMFGANYIVCALLSRYFMGSHSIFTSVSGIGFALVLGIISGILYLVSFVLLQTNIQRNGVALSATFMKLGVLIPTVMAILFFHEVPKLKQLFGILLVILAIIVMNFEKEEKKEKRMLGLLLVMLVCSGLTDSMVNILGNSSLKDPFLFLNFVMAFICALIAWKVQKQKILMTKTQYI